MQSKKCTVELLENNKILKEEDIHVKHDKKLAKESFEKNIKNEICLL